MRKLYALLALVATIIGSALAFGDGLTFPFSMPATTCTSQFVRSIAAATGTGTCATVAAATDISGLGGYATISAGTLANSLAADVNLNNTSNYFDGPTVAQGSTGTWFASGTVTLTDAASIAGMLCKLWDGTTIIASANVNDAVIGNAVTVSLSGFLATPAGNLRISCRDATATTGKILFNNSGNSKDSTITAFRVN